MTPEKKKEIIAQKMDEILDVLGISLPKTPTRVANLLIDEVFPNHEMPQVTLHDQKVEAGEMVLVKNISFISFCEHHLVPFVGTVHFAYLPQGQIIGLSKIYEIIRFLAKKPQLQEGFTSEIADHFTRTLGFEDVAVTVAAKHYCVMVQGIQDFAGILETRALRGQFQKDPELRREFLSAIGCEDKEQREREEEARV